MISSKWHLIQLELLTYVMAELIKFDPVVHFPAKQRSKSAAYSKLSYVENAHYGNPKVLLLSVPAVEYELLHTLIFRLSYRAVLSIWRVFGANYIKGNRKRCTWRTTGSYYSQDGATSSFPVVNSYVFYPVPSWRSLNTIPHPSTATVDAFLRRCCVKVLSVIFPSATDQIQMVFPIFLQFRIQKSWEYE